jgi:mannose/cellobiose epimerase-like protein (N-acyl-D-glucosamine 2-epimerase family)
VIAARQSGNHVLAEKTMATSKSAQDGVKPAGDSALYQCASGRIMKRRGLRIMQHETSRRIADLLRRARNHLDNELVPFWEKRAKERIWDNTYGGFVTNFDDNAIETDTPEKYLNTQARIIWSFSRLAQLYPEKRIFSEMTRKGVDFLISNFWDKDFGGWFWKIRKDGSTLVNDKVVYGQSFAIYALSQYYLTTSDQRGLDYASQTFDLLQTYCADTLNGGYCENLEPDWQVAAVEHGGDRKGLDTHMHLMEAFTTLYLASGQEIHRRKLVEVIDLLMRYMIDHDHGCGRNQFDAKFKPIPAIAIRHTWNDEREGDFPAEPVDTTSYGHNVELVWLMHAALDAAGIDARDRYLKATQKLMDHAVQYGVDWKYGGIYRDGNHAGDVLVDEKEWWQQSEVLVGFLEAYAVFKDERYLDAYENCWNFIDKYMIKHDIGEWYTLLERDGTLVDANLGNPWKVCYHNGRAMMESVERLERISKL